MTAGMITAIVGLVLLIWGRIPVESFMDDLLADIGEIFLFCGLLAFLFGH
jgi:hypothetical protein